MNPNLILPATLAIAVHAFLLYGGGGRAPKTGPVNPNPADPADPAFVQKALLIEDEPPRHPAADFGDLDIDRPLKPVPGITDVPPVNIPVDAHLTPIIPVEPGTATERIDRIPVNWDPRGGPRADRGADIIDYRRLDRVPAVRMQASPEYPFEMRHQGIDGTVEVEFVVDTDGRVCGARVVSATNRAFEEPALKAVARWRFEPGLVNGRKVKFRMSVPLVFRIGDI